MKLQPEWLLKAIREANDAWNNQDDICNRITADKYSTFENHPEYDKWVRATILYERALEHAKRTEHRWQSMTPDEQYCQIHGHRSIGIREISEDGGHTIVGGEDTVRTYSYKEKYCLQCLAGLEIVDDADIQSV